MRNDLIKIYNLQWANHNFKMNNGEHVRIEGRNVHVFTGHGWKNYSKFIINKSNNTLRLCDGKSLSKDQYKELLERVL